MFTIYLKQSTVLTANSNVAGPFEVLAEEQGERTEAERPTDLKAS